MPTETQIVEALHQAADVVGVTAPTPELDTLASAGAEFLRSSTISTENGVTVDLTSPQALGYGVMLGWLAREALIVHDAERGS